MKPDDLRHPRPGHEILSVIPHKLDVDLPGAYFHEYGSFHAGIAARFKPRRVLEVGVRVGYAASAWCQGWDGIQSYVGVDPELEIPRSNEMARANVHAAGFKGKWILLDMTSQRAAEYIRTQKWPAFDLVHIDADHHYDHALHDMLAFWPMVAPGGVMIADDVANPDGREVTHAALDAARQMDGIEETLILPMHTGAWVVIKEP